MKYIILVFSIFFIGCTGKVQTNPIPAENELVYKQQGIHLKQELKQKRSDEYKVFVDQKIKHFKNYKNDIDEYKVNDEDIQPTEKKSDKGYLWNFAYEKAKR